MKNLNRNSLRQLILKELESIGEDVLVKKSMQKKSTPPMGASNRASSYKCSMHGDMYEADCDECSSMYEEMHANKSLNESDCGCGGSSNPSNEEIENVDYAGIIRNLLGMHSTTMHDHAGLKNHRSGAYMSKSQLYKVQEYSEKLYNMIPEGHNLEDWMRTKISQIADDISEVYHALKHDVYKGK